MHFISDNTLYGMYCVVYHFYTISPSRAGQLSHFSLINSMFCILLLFPSPFPLAAPDCDVRKVGRWLGMMFRCCCVKSL